MTDGFLNQALGVYQILGALHARSPSQNSLGFGPHLSWNHPEAPLSPASWNFLYMLITLVSYL